MKYLTLGLIGFLLINVSGFANNNPFASAKQVRMYEEHGVPAYVLFGEKEEISESGFFSTLFKEVEIPSSFSFQLLSSTRDELGFTHNRYRQFYNNIPVAYSNLVVHVKNGKVYSFNGIYHKRSPSSSSTGISEKEALKAALQYVNASKYMWEIPGSEENYLPRGELAFIHIMDSKGSDLKLTYQFNIYAQEPLSRELVFVNSQSKEIEFSENLIHTGGNTPGVARTVYSDTQNIIVDSVAANVFRLRDSTRGTAVITLNCQRSRGYANAVDFVDSDNFWNNFNGSLDQYATDAHWGAEETYDYFLNAHNRNSIDNSGFPLVSYIHYDVNYANAFWNGQVMTYGDGNAMTNPLTALDIVGHEITHGLTDFTSDLIYANESGALNESFSDIFGTAIEFAARPNRANWFMGEDIGAPFRSMSNPNQFNDPDTYGGSFWIDQNCTPTANNDRCGVHTNSGVQNYWFYLLSTGAIGVNDNADSFNVSGIGMTKAEKIAFRNLTVYLSPSSNYEDARFYSIVSAIDLYGACSPEVEATTNAWHAVGVGNRYVNGVEASFSAIQDTAFCSFPVVVKFESSSSNVTNFLWDFGNGTGSTQSDPSVVYNSQGVYSVQLIGDGGSCGSDTVLKTNYITVDNTILCTSLLPDTGRTIVTDCNGRLYDSGGFGGKYDNDVNSVYTISVPTADFITLDFKKIEIESGLGFNCNRDYIEVYDGSSKKAPFLGRFCRNYLPANNQIISSSNEVTLHFYTDEVSVDEGFLIDWSCGNSINSPVADFDANTDSSCTGKVSFENKSTGGGRSFLWDFGDGTSSTEINPVHTYYADGNYSVNLQVQNAAGSDVMIKPQFISINRPSLPNVSNDTFCIGENAGLKVFTNDNIEWYRDTMNSSIYSLDSLTVFNLRRDTSFFVRTISKNQKFTGGKPLNSGPGLYSNDNDYIVFDVHKKIMLQTMILFSNRAGIRKLNLWNKDGELVQTKDIYVPNSALQVNINMEIFPDSNYRISFSERDVNLYKNTSGAAFPYVISNLVTLKSANNPGEYPYFYRWGVSELPCVSNFQQITATVDSSCTLVGVEQIKSMNASIGIQPNPFKSELVLTYSGDASNSTVFIEVYNSTGGLVFSENQNQLLTEKRIELDFSNFTPGVYFLSIKGENVNELRKIVKIE